MVKNTKAWKLNSPGVNKKNYPPVKPFLFYPGQIPGFFISLTLLKSI
jgi:hypothetical protein